MNAAVTILTALQFGIPVQCHSNQAEWVKHTAQLNVPKATAYFAGYDQPIIALGPYACKEVLTPTLTGAYIMAHELTHWNQYRNNTPRSEVEADSIGRLIMYRVLRQLERMLHRKARPAVTIG